MKAFLCVGAALSPKIKFAVRLPVGRPSTGRACGFTHESRRRGRARRSRPRRRVAATLRFAPPVTTAS